MAGADNITGLILAGGRGTRMGGLDKGLILLDGRPMVEYAISRLRPQVANIVISANRNQDRYRKFGHQVVSDMLEDYPGPLAGIAAALPAMSTDYAVTVPCDTPLLSDELVARLWRAMQKENTDLAVAHDGWRIQPGFMLMKRTLHADLTSFLAAGERKVERWIEHHRFTVASFGGYTENFANVNDPDDRKVVEMQLRDQRLS